LYGLSRVGRLTSIIGDAACFMADTISACCPAFTLASWSALLHVILLLLIIIMMLLVMLLVVVVVVLALPLAGHHRHVSSAGRCCPILLRVFNSAQHGPRAPSTAARPSTNLGKDLDDAVSYPYASRHFQNASSSSTNG
jgi:hypothetical protein